MAPYTVVLDACVLVPITLDVHVYRLRNELERDPAHPRSTVTARGVGYLLHDGRRSTSVSEDSAKG